ncbi:MAG TPA: hypothetical protein V6C96_01205, partial [Vampirovibrionales bacterium]
MALNSLINLNALSSLQTSTRTLNSETQQNQQNTINPYLSSTTSYNNPTQNTSVNKRRERGFKSLNNTDK